MTMADACSVPLMLHSWIKNVFVKIRYIFQVDNAMYCVCRTFERLCALHELILPNMPENLRQCFERASFHFKLRKGAMKIVDVEALSHHTILFKLKDGNFHGVKVIHDFEHD